MTGYLQCILFFLVLVKMDKCNGRSSLSGLPRRTPPTKAAPPSMPKKLFSMMMNVTTTDDFLQKMSMSMYNREKKKGFLPSDAKVSMIKSRSSGGLGIPAGIISLVDLNPQPCVLRPYIYFLEQPPMYQGAFIWPYAVKVPRCSGSCNVRHDIIQCRAASKIEISLRTYHVSYRSSRKRRDVMEEFAKLKDPIHELMKRSSSQIVNISSIQLEAHTGCHCECAVTDAICARQSKVFNKHFCQCECPSVQKCKLPYRWDDNQCKCICGEDPVQMHGLCQRNSYGLQIWNSKTCACECMAFTACSSKEKPFNKRDANCQCKCTVKSCPAKQTLHFSRRYPKRCYCQ